MNEIERKYQGMIVQGWIGMLFLLITMFITDLVEFAIRGGYEEMSALLTADPGISGLWFLACLICLNVLAQMSIRALHKKTCRWLVFFVTLSYTLFFVAHQVVHLINGEGFDIHFIIDITHHIIGFWACWAAYKWVTLASSPNQQLNEDAATNAAPVS